MNNSTLRRFKWLLIVALVAGAVFWVRSRPLPVDIHVAATTAVTGETMGTGTLEARVSATISPKLTGRLTTVRVDQGDRVAAGDELAVLDDAEAKRQFEVAEAALAAAAATVERVRTEEARADAVLAQARLDHARTISLAQEQTVSASERDKAVERLNIAEAEAARARAVIVEAESMHTSAISQVALQRELLAHTRLLAPFDGLVVRRDRDPGDVVAPGGAVMELVSLDQIWVAAWVDETAIARLETGQQARIVFRSEPEISYPGRVVRLGRETDRETREFLVDVQPERLPANWAIGQRAEVFVTTGRREAVVAVPSGFIAHRDGRLGVFVVRGGRARFQSIRVGLRGRDLVEVVEGLGAGDSIALAAKPGNDIEGRRVSAR